MKMKRFIAADMRLAMQQVGDALGPDALILSSRKTDDGVEIIAAVDYEEDLLGTDTATIDMQTAESISAPDSAIPDTTLQPDTAPQAGIQPLADQSLKDVQSEIRTLRSMLEVPLSQLGWDEVRRREPVRAAIIERLQAMQLHPVIANRIADQVTEINDDLGGWQQAMDVFEHMIPLVDDDLLTEGGVAALVGPTGVGKTTTIAKIAARFAMQHGRKHVALVTMDHYRIGAHEQLRTYGRLLGVPVHIAGDEEELRAVLNQMQDRKLVLIDTAGTSQYDIDLKENYAALELGDTRIRRYLVMSATAQTEVNDDVFSAFSQLGPDKCILTKLDEATCLGGVLSVLIKHRMPLAWTGNGQRVPDDFHSAQRLHLAELAEELAGSISAIHSDEAWIHALETFGADAHAHI